MDQDDGTAVQLPLFPPQAGPEPEETDPLAEVGTYSSWVVYVDESGNYNTDTYTAEYRRSESQRNRMSGRHRCIANTPA